MDGSSAGPRLIIVCGLPGSGKTTRAKALAARLPAVRFSPDEWLEALALDLYDEERRGRIEALQWRLARELLARGLVVIIEWGTWGRSERDALRLGARALGAAVELHYLDAPVDVLFERIRRRGMEHWSTRPSPARRSRGGVRPFRPRTRRRWRCSTRPSRRTSRPSRTDEPNIGFDTRRPTWRGAGGEHMAVTEVSPRNHGTVA
jgi:predicted kinase